MNIHIRFNHRCFRHAGKAARARPVILLGDRVHLTTRRGKLNETQIATTLTTQGIQDAIVEPGEITLEDIFINLTHKAELTPL